VEIKKTTVPNTKNTKKNIPTKLSAIEISKTKLHVGTQHLPSYTNEAYVHKELKPLTKEQKTIVRYNDKDLAEFRDLIHLKLKKAKEEVDYYSDQIKNFSESDTKFSSMDDGSYTSERESVNQIIGRQQKLIVHLENALARIENKTYGICRETGLLIPKERLRAVPHATLSVEGKKKQK
jgi:DnaK suppressor protein